MTEHTYECRLKQRFYNILKEAGHSPAKAAEIVFDASRGDSFAQAWIGAMIAADTRRDKTGLIVS